MYKNISDLLKAASEILNKFNIPRPHFETETLLCFAFKVKHETAAAKDFPVINYTGHKKFFSYIERRTLKEPIAYIKEEKEFYSLTFYVNRNVLIPRCETELIPEYLLLKDCSSLSIIDLGTGSGNIILSVKNTALKVKCEAIDFSSYALKVAVKNKNLLLRTEQGKQNINFYKAKIGSNALHQYHYVLSNPPYIDKYEMTLLMDDVKNFEPLIALNGGDKGLFFYKKIARNGKKYLFSCKSEVLVEVGMGMLNDVVRIFAREGFKLSKVLVDLAGIERILIFNYF